MSIKFHCEHCSSPVSAPDSAGGRQGRCPSCRQVVYIPSPDPTPFELAPLDEKDEQRRRMLAERTRAAERELLAQARSSPSPDKPDSADEKESSVRQRGEGGVVLQPDRKNKA